MRFLILAVVLGCLVGCGSSGEFDGCRDELDDVMALEGEVGLAEAQGLEVVDGDLILCNMDGIHRLPNLRAVEGRLILVARTQGVVELPSLRTVGGDVVAFDVDLELPELTEATSLIVRSNSKNHLSLPSLVSVRAFESTGSVDVPELVAIDSFVSGPLVAPKLLRFDHGTISPFGQSDLPILDNFISGTFDLALTSSTVTLPSVREAQTISFGASSGPGTAQHIRMPALQTADQLWFRSQSELTSIDFPSLTSLKTIEALGNPKLAHCDLMALAQRTDAILNSIDSLQSGPCN